MALNKHAERRIQGATEWVSFADTESLARAVGILLGCHPHHFAVATDFGENSLFCSKMAVQCILPYFNQGTIAVSPENLYE